MKEYEVELNGMTTLLMHGAGAVGMDDEESSKKKGGEAIKGDPDEWKKTIYYDEKVGVFILEGGF